VHPHAATLYNNLAAMLERKGQMEEAMKAAERGVVEDTALPQLHKNVGDLQYRAAHYDEALESFQRAVKLQPELGADVHMKLGNIRFRRQETAEAVRHWERALELDPANAIVRANLDSVRRGG
jgi:tetratricopeptide (TPR) repeat protein